MSALPEPSPVVMLPTGVGDLAIRRTPTRGPGRHEPAVLVHGLGGNAMNWLDLAEGLADRLDCVAVDLPGFGSSPPPPDSDYSIAAHMRAAAAVAETLFPGQPVHLFGNSMGGAISVQLAARRPELVRTVCLVSPALPDGRLRSTNVQIPVMAMPMVGRFMFDRLARVGPEQRVRATFEMVFADPAAVPAQRRAEAEAEARRRDDLPWVGEAFIGSARSLLSTYLDRGPERPWKLAADIAVPTLLVYGHQDKLVHVSSARRAIAAFQSAHVMVIPDSGHVAMMEHPELVDRWWREFLGGSPDPVHTQD